MRNPVLFRCLRTLPTVAFAIVLLSVQYSSWAQPAPALFKSANSGKIPLSTTVTNGNMIISWPMLPGKWQLIEQQPAMTGDWAPVLPDKYRTNGNTVSVNLPLPQQTALYRLIRFGLSTPGFQQLPPIPPPPTNLPPPPRFPGHP